MAKIFLFLLLIGIPFGTRFLVYQFTPGFHEYETTFVYLSDVVLILFLLFYFAKRKFKIPKSKTLVTSYYLLITFLFFTLLSIFWAPDKGLAAYSFARLALMVLMALAVGGFLKDKEIFKRVLAILAVLAVIESSFGFLQFARQENLGLGILGESPVSIMDGKTSKIFFGDGRLMRAYGTFPHPNVLGAFLMLGLFSLYYFWLKRPSEWKIFSSVKNLLSDLWIGLGIFAVIFGLMISFSRTAWLIGILLTIFLIAYAIFSKKYLLQGVRLAILVFAIAGIFLFKFNEFILPRAQIKAGEPAVVQRLNYNRIGFELTTTKPLGVGIGNQVLYSVNEGIYQKFGLNKVWHWQPIHNLYLLIASEIGILGLLSFLIFIGSSLFKLLKSELSLEKITALTLFSSFLILGLFDHYFWTLEQGRLMLWLVIGLALASLQFKSEPEKDEP